MDSLVIIFLTGVLVVAAVYDIRWSRIPNLLNYPAMMVGLAYHIATKGLEGLIFSATGLVLGTLMLLIPYLIEGMGAGDAKLMGAVGAILGPKGVFFAFLFTAIVGAIYALILIWHKPEYGRGLITRIGMILKKLVITRQFTYRSHTAPVATQGRVYYGAAIAVGTLCYLLWELSRHRAPGLI